MSGLFIWFTGDEDRFVRYERPTNEMRCLVTYWKRIVIIGCLLALFVPAAGCDRQEGRMERAGKSVDRTIQNAEDSTNDTIGDVKRKLGFHEPGPMEKLLGESGRGLDEAIWGIEDFFSDMYGSAKTFLNDLQK